MAARWLDKVRTGSGSDRVVSEKLNESSHINSKKKGVSQTRHAQINSLRSSDLKLEACSQLHLEHLAARVNIVNEDDTRNRISDPQEVRVCWAATQSAKLTVG